MYKSHKIQHGKIITAVVECIIESGKTSSNAEVGVEMIMGLCLATFEYYHCLITFKWYSKIINLQMI